jgi:hypothetical protein
MKIFIILTLLLITKIFAQETQIVSQEGIDLITQRELRILPLMFNKYMRCSREEIPRCYDGHIHGAELENEHVIASEVCLLRYNEKVNSYGVTDQSACLTKHQEIRDLLFPKALEKYFLDWPDRRFLPKDFFEILDKYPKVLNVEVIAERASQVIKGAYGSYIDCTFLNNWCGLNISSNFFWGVTEVIRRYCQSPNKPTFTNYSLFADRFYLQPDDEAALQCSAFYKEVISRGFNQMIDEGYPRKIILYSNDKDTEYESFIARSKQLQLDLDNRVKDPSQLKEAFNFYSGKTSGFSRIYDFPWGMIQVKTIKLLQDLLRTADPTFDTTLPPDRLSYEEYSFTNLPKKNWITKTAPIIIPQVTCDQFDNISVIGDFISPGKACGIPHRGLLLCNRHKDCGLVDGIKNGKPIPMLGPVIYLPNLFVDVPPVQAQQKAENQPLVNSNVTSTDANQPLLNSNVTSNEANETLSNQFLELAKFQSKIELSNELNCSTSKETKICKAFSNDLTTNIPGNLNSLCKTNLTCVDYYKTYQAALKEGMKQELHPEIASFKVEGAFVEPFKTNRAIQEYYYEAFAEEKVIKPALLKILSPRTLRSYSLNANLDRITRKVCDKTEQEEAGGDYNKCRNIAKKIVESLGSARLTLSSPMLKEAPLNFPNSSSNKALQYPFGIDPISETQTIKNSEVIPKASDAPAYISPSPSQPHIKSTFAKENTTYNQDISKPELTDKEIEDVFDGYKRDKPNYSADDDDSIFKRVSKAYTRSLEKVLLKKEK